MQMCKAPRQRSFVLVLLSLIFLSSPMMAQQNQIDIPTIDQMPNMPRPYQMRNWREVAKGYDTLVFNPAISTIYPPLVWVNNNSINYPGQLHFGLYTAVGPTQYTAISEAINCIPAVVGASLVGIDKTDQFGHNWVQMCQDWFNKSNGQNVYKNGFNDLTNDDFWYETMPNVFFYQLNYLHPNTTNFEGQFISVADQFAKMIFAMGGSTTPWKLPNINHQGFDFVKMVPFDQSWQEPEAAGAIGWILYNAYFVTGNSKYRIAAELAMEALSNSPINPAYEIQLPYGAYTAARMNAELGTNYNVQTIVNWLFTESYVRPPWGTISGPSWGAYDVDGLVGEAYEGHGYAFAMNVFEQIGCLVPMVRYDPRFATAIGKWVLNAANAARLFYPSFLDSVHQDTSYKWSEQYDPNSYIAHEAIHRLDPSNSSISPYASGDATSGSQPWGKTTLSLYGSSHVGILGAIIDTTNVSGILRLNLLATDYYRDSAYASYLYYNPDSVARLVSLDVGSSPRDIYDAVSHQVIVPNAVGQILIPIPANSAVVAVLTPAGGSMAQKDNERLVNGVVVDYRYPYSGNYPPRIKSLASADTVVLFNDTTQIYCTASDVDRDSLSYRWYAAKGKLIGAGQTVSWVAPDSAGKYLISCVVDDNHGYSDSQAVYIDAVKMIKHPPSITTINGNPRVTNPGGSLSLVCHATDPDGNAISYTWTAQGGTITGSDSAVSWTAPPTAGYYEVYCTVNDGFGGTTSDSIGILVQDFSAAQTGSLVAYYPFDNGSVKDASGNGNDGINTNAQPGSDRFGNPAGAMYFNGSNSYIQVSTTPSLNFQNAITVSFWMKITEIFSSEEYPISHNKWYRWKVSISGGHLRWSITASANVKDLDSESPLVADSLYFVTVTYDGSAMEIFLNGNLDAYTKMSGPMPTTTANLVIGAAAGASGQQEFDGTLDDIRIYNYAVPFPEIDSLLTGIHHDVRTQIPTTFGLSQNFPNPFNPTTRIEYDLPTVANVTLVIYDVLGRRIRDLVRARENAGRYSMIFNAAGLASGVYFYQLRANSFVETKSMIVLK